MRLSLALPPTLVAVALAAAEIRDAVVSDAATFFGDAIRKDDITLVLGKIS